MTTPDETSTSAPDGALPDQAAVLLPLDHVDQVTARETAWLSFRDTSSSQNVYEKHVERVAFRSGWDAAIASAIAAGPSA